MRAELGGTRRRADAVIEELERKGKGRGSREENVSLLHDEPHHVKTEVRARTDARLVRTDQESADGAVTMVTFEEKEGKTLLVMQVSLDTWT